MTTSPCYTNQEKHLPFPFVELTSLNIQFPLSALYRRTTVKESLDISKEPPV